MDRQKLLKLLKRNEFSLIFEHLDTLSAQSDNPAWSDEVIMLQGRYARFETDRKKGLLSHETRQVEEAVIRSGLQELIKEVGANSNILKDQDTRVRSSFRCGKRCTTVSFSIFGVVLFCIGLMPVHRVEWHGSIVTDHLSFTLAEQWKMANDLFVKNCYLENLSLLQGFQDTIQIAAPRTFDAEISGEYIKLDEGMSFDKGEKLSVYLASGEVVLSVNEHPIRGKIDLKNVDIIISEGDKKIEVEGTTPEIFQFETREGGTLRFYDDLTFSSFYVKEFDLFRRDLSTPSLFESTVLDGRLSIGGVRDSVNLLAGEYLSLEGLRDTRLSVSKKEDKIVAQIEGTVRRIKSGREDKLQSLKPSYIEYLHRHEKIMLYGGVLIWMVGIGWNVRKLLD